MGEFVIIDHEWSSIALYYHDGLPKLYVNDEGKY